MRSDCHHFVFVLSTLVPLLSVFAEDNSFVQTGIPRKILVGDYSTRLLALVNEQGDIDWKQPIRQIHDASRLPNGNVLFQRSWTDIVEIDSEGATVWKYDAANQHGNTGKKVEVHAFQRLANGDNDCRKRFRPNH